MEKRCDIGADCQSIGDHIWYRPPCLSTPTYRWHQSGPNNGWADGWAPGHWNYRCDTHVKWLSVPNLIVKPLKQDVS
jgi:hypothetical protein